MDFFFLFKRTLLWSSHRSKAGQENQRFNFYQAQGRRSFLPCTCGWWLVDGLQAPVVMWLFHRSAFLQTVPYILWMNLNQSTKSMGFTRKIPRHVECVKRVLKNLLKWSKKSMTHLVALGKNTLCESEQPPFSVCGRSFYCRQQQDVVFLTIV